MSLVARLRLAPYTARSLARLPALGSLRRPPPRTRTGSPAGRRLRLQAAPPLAPSLWLAPHAVAGAADAAEGGEAAAWGGWEDGRTPAQWERRGPAAGVGGGKGGSALTVYFKVTSPTINSCRRCPAPEPRRRPAGAAFYRRIGRGGRREISVGTSGQRRGRRDGGCAGSA